MTLDRRLTEDLIRLAHAGCGFTISGRGRQLNDLVSIAQAARIGSAQITIFGVANYSTDDLIRIGQAGAGRIIFDDV